MLIINDYYSNEFIRGLENNDLTKLASVPKTDLHNHCSFGGNIDILFEFPPKVPTKFNSIDDMREWVALNIDVAFPGVEGKLERIAASFLQAKKDNIEVLALNFGVKNIENFGGINSFINAIVELKEKTYPKLKLLPELGINKESSLSSIENKIVDYIDSNFFWSLDLNGNESEDAEEVTRFADIYKYAKKKNIKLKAHIGEFSSPKNIIKYVEVLNLDEIHHGIKAYKSKETMEYLKQNNIILNLCPTSNTFFSVCSDDLSEFKYLYEAGVSFSINTDDYLIFNSSVSMEYLKLFKFGVFTAKQLDLIRVKNLKKSLIEYNEYINRAF